MEGDNTPFAIDFKSHSISIHSLAWRETILRIVYNPDFWISIHSLAWRETSTNAVSHFGRRYFNPLPRMEGDINRLEDIVPIGISIHSLAWRETTLHFVYLHKFRLFQSTPSHGGRQCT